MLGLSDGQEPTITDMIEPSAPANKRLYDQRGKIGDMLRNKLIECGWRDDITTMVRKYIEQKGVDDFQFKDLIDNFMQNAKDLVPEQVKSEMKETIRRLNSEGS